MSTVEALEKQLTELQAEAAMVGRRVRCRQQQRRRTAMRDSMLSCAPNLLRTAVAIFIVTSGDMTLAATFLETRRRIDADFRGLIQTSFDSWPARSVAEFPNSPSQKKLYDRAMCFKAEAETVAWIRTQNVEKEIAPQAQEVYDHYLELLADESKLKQRAAGKLNRAARKFASLLRKRWSLKFRTLPEQDCDSPAECLRKACASDRSRFVTILGAKIGLLFRARNWLHFLYLLSVLFCFPSSF